MGSNNQQYELLISKASAINEAEDDKSLTEEVMSIDMALQHELLPGGEQQGKVVNKYVCHIVIIYS